MTKLLNLPRWLLLTTLVTATAVACGDDDDDDSTNAGGSPSAGRGGSMSGGRAGSTSGGSSRGGSDTSNAGNGGDGMAAGPGNGGSAGTAGSAGAGGDPGAGAGGMAGAGGEGGGATAALRDDQILLVLDTLNEGEVDEAYAALPRLTVTAVQAFAQTMVMDHNTARQSVASAANSLQLNPSPSDVQLNLKQKAEAHVAMLRATPTANLDRAYIEMQVAAHEEALALLNDLEANADDAALRTLIGTLETAVQGHYDQAVAIVGGL